MPKFGTKKVIRVEQGSILGDNMQALVAFASPDAKQPLPTALSETTQPS